MSQPPLDVGLVTDVMALHRRVIKGDLSFGVVLLVGSVATLLLKPCGATNEQIAALTEELVDRIKAEVRSLRPLKGEPQSDEPIL